jgi:hypothetical protein
MSTRGTITARIAALPWDNVEAALDAQGFACTPQVLSARECAALERLYDTGRFRSTITMARHRFGEGEYKYFDHPLPPAVAELRAAFYPRLARVASRWSEQLGSDVRYPDTLDAFVRRCHAAGQRRPTPLLLRYEPGGWNALHQDLYGEIAFPFQVATVLDRPGIDFEGGELVLTEQRPRAQSRAHVAPMTRGAFVVFSTHHRPVAGARGFHRVTMRHGVSTLTRGRRTTLGVIFHDAA